MKIAYPVVIFAIYTKDENSSKDPAVTATIGSFPLYSHPGPSFVEFLRENGKIPASDDEISEETAQAAALKELSDIEWVLYGASRAWHRLDSSADPFEVVFNGHYVVLRASLVYNDQQYIERMFSWGVVLTTS